MKQWHLNHRAHGSTPWSVQVEAMRLSEGHDRFAYHLECGLGKSSLTFNDYLCDNEVDLMVVFAPQSFKIDWTFIPGEWGRPDIPTWYYPRHPVPINAPVGVYAVNYEGARSGVFHDLEQLMTKRRCMLVIDEATAIMSPNTPTTKGVRALAKLAAKVRVLNGTPLVKNVMDFYAPLRCLGQINGVNPVQFRNRYGVMGGFMGRVVQKQINPDHEQELMEIWDKCSFRALKRDWRKDLPPQIIVDPIHLEMTPKQRNHYNEMMTEFFTVVNGDLEVSADLILVQMSKLRQISSCLAMQDDKRAFFEPHDSNPKFKAAFDVHELGPGKSILVCVHKAVVDALMEMATQRGYQPAVIRGAMKPEQLIEEKRRFNDDPDCRIMVAQELAACRGHTLIGGTGNDSCNKMTFVESDFALWERLQMQDRNFRGAQAEPCNVYDLVTSPMDMFAVETLRGKKEMADRADDLVLMLQQRRF